MEELRDKERRVKELLDQRGLDALLLQRVSSFAWYTGGAASYVNTASDFGAASLLLTPSGSYVLANNIEATRLRKEEKLTEQGFEIVAPFWYEGADSVADLAHGMRLGADVPYPGATDLSADISRLRSHLTSQEVDRYRHLSQICAEAMDAAVRKVDPGQSEYEIAALLSQEAQSRGVQPIVNLIATDRRIFEFRHPLPTDKKLDRYAMLVLCGRKWGLVSSVTRLVHFGELPDELQHKQEACAHVDATFIAATRPGARLGDVFSQAVEAYGEMGYPDEWMLHHQGGSASYEPREQVVTAASEEVVVEGQAFAWNPSIAGVKCEDTILVGRYANEIMTAIPEWPVIEIEVLGQAVARPAILVVD